MRPASHTSMEMNTSISAMATAVSHAGTPAAIRIGISVGLKSGMSERTASSLLPGLLGRVEIPSTYGTTMNIVSGATAPATSSWRETSAPMAANISAYARYPSRNQTIAPASALAATEPGSVSACAAQTGHDTGRAHECELPEAEDADAGDFPEQQLPGADRGQQEFDDAARLLLDDALRHRLPVERERDVHEDAGDDADGESLTAMGIRRLEGMHLDARCRDGAAYRLGIDVELTQFHVERRGSREEGERAAQRGIDLVLDLDLDAERVADDERVELAASQPSLAVSQIGDRRRRRVQMNR